MSLSAMSDTERLMAIEAIKQLKARRDRALDTKDWATFEALHAPDLRSERDGRPPWTSASEMTAQLRALSEGVTTIHHSHTPDITFLSRDKAAGMWAAEDRSFWTQGDEAHWLRSFGFYHEAYERRDGVWVITSRRFESVRLDTSPGAASLAGMSAKR